MLSIRVMPIRRDIEVLINKKLSPQAQSAAFARFAREKLEEAKATNARALGAVPPYETFVDGVEGVSEDNVRPKGRIIYKFEIITDALAEILTLLQQYSPVRSGRYANSHELFADGVQVDNPSNPAQALEYVFMNLQPYARKIEGTEHSGGKKPPQSKQAPDGVYNVVADIANRRFGNVAQIRFGYRTALSGAIQSGRAGNASSDRNPAIIVRMR